MPHVVLEYSAGLETQAELQSLCQALFDALAKQPAIPNPASLKIRACPQPFGVIGTDPQSYTHATLRLLPGRDDATKSHLTGIVLDVMKAHLPEVGSLTAEAVDMHGASYAKRVL
jgi:5-carboxymethyl-2-hydroxymuconate isomerase